MAKKTELKSRDSVAHMQGNDEMVDKICFLAAIILVAFIPIVYDPHNFQIFALPKSVLFKFGGAIIAIFWSISQLNRPLARPFPGHSSMFFAPLLCMLLLTILATMTSIDPWMSFVGVYGRFYGLQGLVTSFVIYLVLVSTARGKADSHLIIHILYFSGAIVGVYGILQFLGMDPINPAWFLFAGGRAYSFTGNADFLGNLLALLLPFCFFLLGSSQGILLKSILALETLCIIGGIVSSQTRGSLAGAACSLLSIMILSKYFIFKGSDWRRLQKFMSHALLFIFIFTLVCWFVFNLFETPESFFYPLPFLRLIYVFWPGKRAHFGQESEEKKGKWPFYFFLYLFTSYAIALPLYMLKGESDVLDRYFQIFEFHRSIRILLWQDFFSFIKHYFYLGSGPETYRRAFMPFKGLELGYSSAEEHDSPHNHFLSLWGAVGVLGPIFSAWVFYIIFDRGLRALKKLKDRSDILLGISFFSMGVSYLVWSIPAFDTIVNLPVFTSLLAAYAIWMKQVDATENSPAQDGRWGRWRALVANSWVPVRKAITPFGKPAFFLLCLGFFPYSGYLAFQHWQADKQFLGSVRATQVVESMVAAKKAKEASNYFYDAIEGAKRASGLNPEESYYYFQLSRLYLERAKQETVREQRDAFLSMQKWALDKADEHPWAPESIGIERMFASLLTKSYDQAIIDGEKVLGICPWRTDVRQNLDKLYYSTHQWLSHPELIPKVVDNANIILRFSKYANEPVFTRLFLIDIFLYKRDFMSAMEQIYFIKDLYPKKYVQIKKIIDKIQAAKNEARATAPFTRGN